MLGTWPRPSSAISRSSHPSICPSIDPSSTPSFTSSRPLPPTRSTRSSPSSIFSPAISSKQQPEKPLIRVIIALTQAAARAFGKHQINVNAICPGVVATDMWKVIDSGFRDHGLTGKENEAFDSFAQVAVLGRASKPDDLVGVARFLASSDSDFMTGQSLMVDGGMVFV